MDYIHIILLFYYVSFVVCESTCVTPDGISGSCIELKDCEYLQKELNKDPSYIINSRCGPNNPAELANSFVCCNLLPSPNPKDKQCGVPFQGNINVRQRIFGGTTTLQGDYPWTTLLRYKYDDEIRTSCAGTLISNRYVITAAHCVSGAGLPYEWKLAEVSLGEWNISADVNCNEENCSKRQVYGIEERIVHENYDPESKHQLYDIVLLRLNKTVIYSEWIQPICLPYSIEMIELDLNGRDLELVGWGKTESQSFSPILLKTILKGHPKTSCKLTYQNQKLEIKSSQLCGLGKKKGDACVGDSGGPLMLYHNSTQWLSGIVSYGPIPCGSPNYPGVYTRITSFIYWIQNNIRP